MQRECYTIFMGMTDPQSESLSQLELSTESGRVLREVGEGRSSC